ncbi:MAG TPA: hypothetical protein VI689_03420 [Acidimicrobiia bacterium]|nr:hypothetical protein [Acidimicrobiia bacterium]
MHPLLTVFLSAAQGAFPPVDGAVTYLPPLPDGLEAVVSFSGHAFVASRLAEDEFADLEPDGYGTVLHPRLLLRMAGPTGIVGIIDATLVARGTGGGSLQERTDLDDHPRVRYARSIRQEIRVFGDESGLITLGKGLAGRTEMSIETFGSGERRGRALIDEAVALVAPGEPLFAAVSPGHARSLRAFLSRGFVPLGSEVIVRPDR